MVLNEGYSNQNGGKHVKEVMSIRPGFGVNRQTLPGSPVRYHKGVDTRFHRQERLYRLRAVYLHSEPAAATKTNHFPHLDIYSPWRTGEHQRVQLPLIFKIVHTFFFFFWNHKIHKKVDSQQSSTKVLLGNSCAISSKVQCAFSPCP